MNRIFCGELEDLPEGQPLETPLHRKRVRVRNLGAKTPESESLWSSSGKISPSIISGEVTPPLKPPHKEELNGSNVLPSPDLYVEHGVGNGARTAATPTKKRLVSTGDSNTKRNQVRRCLMFGGELETHPEGQPLETPLRRKRVRVRNLGVKNPESESLWSSLETICPSLTSGKLKPPLRRPLKEELNDSHVLPSPDLSTGDSNTKRNKRRRSLMPSSNAKPLGEAEFSSIVNFGSEGESCEENEDITYPLALFRVAKMFADEENEVQEDGVSISLEWPPLPAQTPIAPAPSSIAPALIPNAPTPVAPGPTPMEPYDKFSFNWRAFPRSQTEPCLRRERFSQTNVGPTVSFTSPYDAFTAIWDREIIQVIVNETNKYAQQLCTAMLDAGSILPSSRITRWQDTTVNEIYTYLAIVLAMGVLVKSRLEEYWNTSKDIFSTPGFTSNMTFDRFVLLSRCLHFSDNKLCNPAVLTAPQIKLFKIQPILDHVNAKFSALYTLSQNLALDESLTEWKGWLDINQFIRNKAAGVGVKTYELCESQTGYLWRLEVHAGHDTSTPETPHEDSSPISGKIPDLVLRMLKGLEHRGHTIWMDNYYNSPALARELKVLGFDCVGTLRTCRKFVPKELELNKTDMTVGQVIGCTSGDVDLLVWRDKNRVAFISTYHGIAVTRCGEVLKPTVAADYNICMGGVDKKDQRLSMYPVERKKTMVWYKKLFRRLLNASVVNALILLQNKSLSHRKFRKSLVNDLLAAHSTHTLSPTQKKIKNTTVHCPAQYPLINPPKLDRLKRNCAVCKKRTITYCKACNVAMCVFTCFEPYHTSH